jgi:hypothetical protein
VGGGLLRRPPIRSDAPVGPPTPTASLVSRHEGGSEGLPVIQIRLPELNAPGLQTRNPTGGGGQLIGGRP